MLSSKSMIDNIIQLFAESQDNPYVVGNGIITSMRIGFDKKKLEEKRHEIASILKELGIDEHPLISLSSLTTLKNGEVWNQLQSLEDFQALELLLACSDACGFVHNDTATIQRNIVEMGEVNSILISRIGRDIINDDDMWLKLIREAVVNKMYFLTDSESIKTFATCNQDLIDTSERRHI